MPSKGKAKLAVALGMLGRRALAAAVNAVAAMAKTVFVFIVNVQVRYFGPTTRLELSKTTQTAHNTLAMKSADNAKRRKKASRKYAPTRRTRAPCVYTGSLER